jgi:hypothetical protein
MKIYLACPYSSEFEQVRTERLKIASLVAGTLMRRDHVVFSPLSHSRAIGEVCSLPEEWDFWKVQDEEFIKWCDEMWVVALDGWIPSVGVAAEIELAEKYNKHIRLITVTVKTVMTAEITLTDFMR